MKEPLSDLPNNWETNQLPEIQNLFFKANKLKIAIFSQEIHVLKEIGLDSEFNHWFNHLDENFSEILNGGAIDIKNGSHQARRTLLDMINDLPGNWKQYRIFLNELTSVIDSNLR